MTKQAAFVFASVTLFLGWTNAGGEETATYRITFESTWSSATHPTDFPSGQHFSPLVGATHNDQVTFWEVGGLATRGIEAMAENGSTGVLISEVQLAIPSGNVGESIIGPSMSTSPGSRSFEIEVNKSFPLLTLVSMIAPSPDWFVGTSGFDLRPDGEWISHHVYDLLPYDAGTDAGESYRSPNANILPIPITSLEDVRPFAGSTTPYMGSYTFLRLVFGDLDESGDLDAADMDLLSTAVREQSGNLKFDMDENEVVDSADRDFWVRTLRGTRYGDSNLDGRFDSGDLVDVFQAGQYEDGVAGNSGWAQGDWDGNQEFESSDLVFVFQQASFQGNHVAAATVPEPNSMLSVFLVCLCMLRWRNKTSEARSQIVSLPWNRRFKSTL